MTVTLNRPKRKNAMTLKMFGRMADAWKEASENDDIRVCILTGAEGNFCSGADLKGMAGDAGTGGTEKRGVGGLKKVGPGKESTGGGEDTPESSGPGTSGSCFNSS